MARIRSIKPEVRTSLVVADWPREVRYFWVLLWGYLDDHGRGVDDARLVKADCMPLDDDVTAATVEGWLAMISGEPPEGVQKSSPDTSGPLCRYRAKGRRYMHAVNWREHQRPSHPKDSRIPKCPIHEGGVREESQVGAPSGEPPEGVQKSSRNTPEDFVPEQGAGSREQVVRAGSRERETKTSSELAPRDPDLSDIDRPEIDRICEHLVERMVENGCKRPTITRRWKDAARLMLDRDHRTEQQVHAAIDWCQADEFWRGNILSLPKLREKYDQLSMAARRGTAMRPSTADQRVVQAQAGRSDGQVASVAEIFERTRRPKTISGEIA